MTLSELQQQIKKHKLDAFILTRNNRFLEEDILPEENLLRELTGFTGSAGRLLVFPQGGAVLFVDGRYELQAPLEVPPQIIVNCTTTQLRFSDWLKYKLPVSVAKIGFNPWCLGIREIECLQKELSRHKFIPLSGLDDKKRLSSETVKIFSHDIEYAGVSAEEKISAVLSAINNDNLDAFLITASDSVSWLLNLRSRCLPETPVMRAYALVNADGGINLFIDNPDFSEVQTPPFTVKPFSELPAALSLLKKKRLGLDFSSTPYIIKEWAARHKIFLIDTSDPCMLMKCRKNPVELSGIRKAHIRDGIALSRFAYWLNQQNPKQLSEKNIIDKLRSFRARQELFFSDSFATIAAFAEHGAIVHYHPDKEADRPFSEDSLLLLDSGAQYYDGTTDVTRTFAIGKPHRELIDNYTRVLKAHIHLSVAVFPNKTPGQKLDILARGELWKHGMDYNHGTGHGVGCFLNVHEGPVGISTTCSSTGLEEGMILSIEPGYYLENRYGIRIENLVEVIPDSHPGMLAFSPLTLAPYERRLINPELLDASEIRWLNQYHDRVFKTLSPYLNPEEKSWLKNSCAPF